MIRFDEIDLSTIVPVSYYKNDEANKQWKSGNWTNWKYQRKQRRRITSEKHFNRKREKKSQHTNHTNFRLNFDEEKKNTQRKDVEIKVVSCEPNRKREREMKKKNKKEKRVFYSPVFFIF